MVKHPTDVAIGAIYRLPHSRMWGLHLSVVGARRSVSVSCS